MAQRTAPSHELTNSSQLTLILMGSCRMQLRHIISEASSARLQKYLIMAVFEGVVARAKITATVAGEHESFREVL